MDIADPVLVVGAILFAAVGLAMVASRMIASAAAGVTAELSPPDPELSRIRRRP